MEFEVLVPIAFFASIVAIVKLIVDSRLRKKLIEKGVSAEEARTLLSSPSHSSRSSSFKWGLVTASIGAALVVIHIASFDSGDPIAPGIILLFAGSAFLLHAMIDSWRPRRWMDEHYADH